MATNKNQDVVQGPERRTDQKPRQLFQDDYFDYSPRGQWLRAAVLGANDGLVCVTCLMMGVRGTKDVKAKFLLGLSNLVAGAISIAVREYVSVYSQLDLEVAQAKRDRKRGRKQGEQAKRQLSNPLRVAIAASIAFSSGAVVPLLASLFIRDNDVKLGVLVATVIMTLVVFGWIWSVIGGTRVLMSCFRVLLGGLIALVITYGQTTLLSASGGV